MGSFAYVKARDCWIARVYDPTRPSKERSRTFGKGLGKRDAARLASDVIADLQREADAAAHDRGTVKEYAEKWLARRRRHLSPTTIAGGYEQIVGRIVKQFGRRPLRELSRAEIRDWYDVLRQQTKPKLSETTIERHHQVLRAILYEAVDDEVLARNPIAKLKRPAVVESELIVPTGAAVALAEQLPGDFGRFVRVLVRSGLRRGELIGLAWADIEPAPAVSGERSAYLNIRRAVIETGDERRTIATPKSRRTRRVRIGDDVLTVLEEQRQSVLAQIKGDLHPAGAVFPDLRYDPRGLKPHRPGWASEWWQRVRDDVGMSGVRLHALRHFYATDLLDSGVPINTVQRQLGHSKASTTVNIYGHGTDEGEEAAVRATTRRALPDANRSTLPGPAATVPVDADRR